MKTKTNYASWKKRFCRNKKVLDIWVYPRTEAIYTDFWKVYKQLLSSIQRVIQKIKAA